MFDGCLPARLQAEAPKVVETPEGHQVWEFDGTALPSRAPTPSLAVGPREP